MTCKRLLSYLLSFLLLGAMTARAGDLVKYANKVGAEQGLCVVLGDTDGQAAQQLALDTKLLVYVQIPTARHVAAARQAAAQAGLGLDRLHIAQGPSNRIFLADNLADLVLETGEADAPPPSEILRVLRRAAWRSARRASLSNRFRPGSTIGRTCTTVPTTTRNPATPVRQPLT